MNDLYIQRPTVADIVSLARGLYDDTRGSMKHKQILRPYICPFHILVRHVPRGASLLDVGCGAGLFVLLLTRLGYVRSAIGFDANKAAIESAQGVVARQGRLDEIRFEFRDAAKDSWPIGQFDVVSLIDVMHHVQPDRQAEIIQKAAEYVAPGGILLYKDMVRRPAWRAWANRLHDLLSAGEWIHYVPIDDIVSYARKSGLHLERMGTVNMFWYGHEWCIFRRVEVKA